MAVPKILHQVWIGGEIPFDYLASALHFKQLNPEYEYMLWDDSNVPVSRFPEIYNSFNMLQFKSDLIRYEILNKYGGVYADFDIVWIKPINELVKNKPFLFAKEYPKKSDHSLTNCLIATESNSQIMSSIFDRIPEEWERHKSQGLKEIDFGHRVTGPWMVTKLCREKHPEAWYKDLLMATIYPSFMLKKGMRRLGDLPQNSYGIHCVNHAGELWKAMTRRSNLARDMIRELPTWGEAYAAKDNTSDLVRKLRS
tara:strand:- start:59855 stop:60616 length:762 start_codon:yes stop_codon:yes gene_type:complete